MKYRIVFLMALLGNFINVHSRTFYVDARSGNDTYTGLSPNNAWKTLKQVNSFTFQPGDSILFKSSQEWFGMLYPKGSGTEKKPIVISKYGGPEKPKIHGKTVTISGIEGFQTVFLYNQQHWVIRDLEITNMPEATIRDFDDNGPVKRRGIYIVASDIGEIKGITIHNNYIHHVYGDDSKDFRGSGGILIAALGEEKPSFFNGVRITNNRIYMVNRSGICTSSFWQRRHSYPGTWMNEMGEHCPSRNIVIRGNTLESIGGDGIVPQVASNILMEYNTVNGAASRSEAHNAALWAWNSDSVLIQYNEVFNTKTIRDGMAFDCDSYSIGHTYQYNYTHDNDGGFLLLFGYSYVNPGAENIGHIIRNNLSVNDKNILIQMHGSGHTGSRRYHNLFYNQNDLLYPIKVEGNPHDISIYQNIFLLGYPKEWDGVNAIVDFDFRNNFIPAKMAIYQESNNTTAPTIGDVNRIFDYASGDDAKQPITLSFIQQLWEKILRESEMVNVSMNR